MKLWGGRFKGEADSVFAQFNASLPFDSRLIAADIEGSLAHAESLAAAGILSNDEASRIDGALREIAARALNDPDWVRESEAEDVHSFVESELVQATGNAGYKLHTGRSRNDQVATDLRLFLRGEIDLVTQLILDLQRAIVSLAEANVDLVMPGYTHMQRAQPVLFAHWALAYFEMLARDRARMRETRARLNELPLGAGALAGTGFDIDRQAVARRLGFDRVSPNSIDAVADRDFVVDFASAAALVMVHLSRLAEDLILYSTSEFGFVELSDSVSTGSSLMPQKKNPDPLELIRGKAGRVFGHHAGLLATLKGLPLAYNKDLQEDKEPLFDTIDTVEGSLRVMAIVLRNLKLNGARMREGATGGYQNATDLADYLVRRGMEFRIAHELVGRLVSHAIAEGKPLEALPLSVYEQFSPLFGEDVHQALTVESSLASKAAYGGTSPERVSEALERAKESIEKLESQ
jgi:argininosuccinate lyase